MIAVNGDVGETIGWPDLARAVAAVSRRAGTGPVVFTSNYGEAGAVDRTAPALGLRGRTAATTRSATGARRRIVSVRW